MADGREPVDGQSEVVHSDNSKVCGVVRPIAAMDGYSAQHWKDVHEILRDAANMADYQLELVSESDISGTILGDIVTNLYFNEVVICDVSGRNPNVMFELGMRLAFEKPVVIVVDDETPFSFDISAIKHIVYPKSLRYADVIAFKAKVCEAIKAVVARGSGRGYLQQYGPIEITELQSNKVGVTEIAEQVADLTKAVSALRLQIKGSARSTAFGATFGDVDRPTTSLNNLKRNVLVSIDKGVSAPVQRFLLHNDFVTSMSYEPSSSSDRQAISFTLSRGISEESLKGLIDAIRAIDPSIDDTQTNFDWR